jgi:hypothetical protein
MIRLVTVADLVAYLLQYRQDMYVVYDWPETIPTFEDETIVLEWAMDQLRETAEENA